MSARGGGAKVAPLSPEKSQGMTSIWGKGEQASFDLPDDYVKDYLKVSLFTNLITMYIQCTIYENDGSVISLIGFRKVS